MNTLFMESFTRLCGRSLILAGGFIACFWLTTLPFQSFEGVAVALHPIFIPGQVLHALGGLFIPFGLIGIYLVIGGAGGRLGLAGFLIAFVGGLGFLSDAMIALVAFPPLANHTPETLDATGPLFTGWALGFFVAFAVTQMVGYTVLGIAGWRSGALPKVSCGLLIAGGVLNNLPPIPGMHLVLLAGGVLWGIAAIGLGRAVVGQPRSQVLTQKAPTTNPIS